MESKTGTLELSLQFWILGSGGNLDSPNFWFDQV